MCDGILRLKLPKGIQINRFANDIVLKINGKQLDELVRTFNIAVRSWITGMGLKLFDHIGSKKRTTTVDDQRITSKQAIKYLEVVIDKRLTFREHLTYIGGQCAAISCALVRIMPNLGDLK